MKFKDMTQLGAEERKTKKKEFELELMKMNTQVATGTPPKNAGVVSRLKKDIARLMLIESLSKDSKKSTPKPAKARKQTQK